MEVDTNFRLLTALAAFTVAMTPLSVMAQATTSRPDGWHYGWGWGHMIFGSFMMILFVGGLVLVILLAARWLGGGASHHAGAPPMRKTPLEILEERFARGEIDKDEFEDRKRLLSG